VFLASMPPSYAALAQGMGAEDPAAVLRIYEQMAGLMPRKKRMSRIGK
jgi:hypothetical protein